MIRRFIYVFALLVCLLMLLLLAANAVAWRIPWQPAHHIALHGANFHVVSGAGTQDEKALHIASIGDDDNAVQTIALDHVEADDFQTLRYRFADFPRTLELSLIFRRADTPDDVHAIVLPRPESGTHSYDLRTVPAWHGDILEVGFAEFPTAQLVAPGHGFHPFTLIRAELWSPSRKGALAALLTDWFAHASWSMRSVHALGREIDTARKFSLVLALAIGSISTLVLSLLILGWRGSSRIGMRAFTCIAVAWLILDINWQSDLLWKLGLTRDLYAGKTWSERSRLIADAPLLDVAARVQNAIKNEPTNTHVMIAGDLSYETLRLVYHLLPTNVEPLAGVIGVLGQVSPNGERVNHLANGSVLVYYHTQENNFDATHALLHVGGVDYPATPLLETQALKVYRIGVVP